MRSEVMLDWFENGSIAIPKLLIKHYSHIGLNEAETMFIIQLYTFFEEGNQFPTPDELSQKTTFSSAKAMDMIEALMKKGVLSIEEEQSSILHLERYSLKPLWKKLILFLEGDQVNQEKKEKSFNDGEVYQWFEQEFGRPLSPVECEMIGMWLDQDTHSPQMIKAALKEAVISGKRNFRYIDRILFEWKKNGIKSIEQAKMHSQKFHAVYKKQSNQKKSSQKEGQGPIYNWLEI